MNTPESINSKLMMRADGDLRRRIEVAVKPFRDFLNDGSPHRFKTIRTDSKEEVEVYFRESLRALEQLAFEVNQRRNQEALIDEFLKKVASLDEQLSELRDSIQ